MCLQSISRSFSLPLEVVQEYEDLELMQPSCDHAASQYDNTYMLRLAEEKERNDS